MNAAETLKTSRLAGLTMTVIDGKLTVRGNDNRQMHLVESLRSNKHEIIAIIRAESAKKENKENNVIKCILQNEIPDPAALPPMKSMPLLPSPERARLIGQVLQIGKPAMDWCLVRSNAYFEKYPGSTFEEQDAAAAADYLSWSKRVGH